MEDQHQIAPSMLARNPRSLPELSVFEQKSSYLIEAERRERSEGILAYWRILARHWIAILVASAAGLMLGFLVGIPLKPVYRANTTLEVLHVNDDFMNMRQTQATIQGEDSDEVSEEETEATLLQSPELLDRVGTKLNPNPSPPIPAAIGWRKWLHLNGGSKQSAREKLLGSAAASLKVTNFPRTRLLNVSVDSTDSRLALDFTNNLVQEFIKKNIDARWARTQQTGDWLSHEINDARTRLQDSENELERYASSSGLYYYYIDDEKQTTVASDKLRQIQQQLSSATVDRIAKQSVFELARKSPPESLADVLNDPSLQSLSSRLDDATRQVASLSAVYNPGYAKLQQAQAEVASLQEAFVTHRADLLHRIETDYQGAARREKLLADAYDSQAKQVVGQDERGVKYNVLRREVDSNQALYDTMLNQMKQASIATALHASNVHIVYPAYLLDHPVFPNFKINAGLGLFAGFLCSVGFFFIRNQTDCTFRQPGELKQLASLSELGIIPRLKSVVNGKKSGLPSMGLTRQKFPNNAKLLGASGPYNLMNVTDISIWPIVIPEAFHATLTSILLAEQNGESGRVLVFASPGPGDGKTSVVSNIAIAAAAIGKKVLLVDADLRRPRIHELFGLKNEGLAELLCSETDCERWPEFVQRTKMAGLSIIPAGKAKQGVGILFYSPRLPNLLTGWRERFDLVLVDTPPALSITDARVIATLADGVILVARAGKTTREALLAIQDRFAEDHSRLLGCVLNDWDPSSSGYAYPYYGSDVETRDPHPD